MLTREVNGIAQQGCDNAVINLSKIGSVNFDLESAISLLKEAEAEEAISDFSMLLEDCKQSDEMLIANASASILKFYSYVRRAKQSLLSAYKSLNGKEVSNE